MYERESERGGGREGERGERERERGGGGGGERSALIKTGKR